MRCSDSTVQRSVHAELQCGTLTHYCAHAYICTTLCCVLQASIINDLLDFETLKGSSAAPKVTRVDLDATVHSVVRMFNNTVTSKVRKHFAAQYTQYYSPACLLLLVLRSTTIDMLLTSCAVRDLIITTMYTCGVLTSTWYHVHSVPCLACELMRASLMLCVVNSTPTYTTCLLLYYTRVLQGLTMVYNTQQQHRFVEGDEQSIKRVVINLVRYAHCYWYCYCTATVTATTAAGTTTATCYCFMWFKIAAVSCLQSWL
jgi:hypothetical protein